MTTKFHADSWKNGGKAVADEGRGFTTSATAKIDAMDLGEVGCNNGGTLMDTALALILPPAFNAVRETITGLGGGLEDEGTQMELTGQAFETTEQGNTDDATSVDV